MAGGIGPDTNIDGFPIDPEDTPGTHHLPADASDIDAPGLEGDTAPDDFDFVSYENAIGAGIRAAEDFIDSHVSPNRNLLARMYAAEDTLGTEPGRSDVVAPEVRNGVLGHMPGLLRMFCGTERYVEFRPGPGTPQGQADMQTEYVQFVIENDNPNWYMEFLSAIDDACRRRTGVFTWWWEEREEVTRTSFTGLNEDAYALLQMEIQDQSNADDLLEYEIELTDQQPDTLQQGGTLVPPDLSSVTPEDQSAMAAMGQPEPEMMIYSGVLHKRAIVKRARFRSVPPEELILTPTTAHDVNRYPLIGTREDKTIGELVALGHDEDEIRDLVGGSGDAGVETTLAQNPERLARNSQAAVERIFDDGFADVDPASETVKYCVVYALIDRDGDGIPERRKICTVGDNYRIIYDEIHEDDGVPYAIGCPYPEPHSPFGMSVADMLTDVQDTKTQLIRGTLDSLSESIKSRIAFVQGKVNVDDILNPRPGAAIRTTDTPNAVLQNFAAPFNGGVTMPLIQYSDEEAVKRSGKNPASPSGFDPDSTQSTAREAIGSMIDAANERTEYIARNLAETMFKPLVIGLRALLVRNQDHRRVINLMGRDVAIDPRPWRANLDVRVLVGTGRTSNTKKSMALQQVITAQMAIFEQYGPGNGMVTLENIVNAQHDFLRASGFSDPYRYMGRFDPNKEAQMAQSAAQKAQQPTPEQMLAQIQSQKNQMDFAAKMAKLRNDRDMVILRDDTQRDKAEQDFSLGVAKILGDYGIKIDEAHVRSAMAANDMAHGAIQQANDQQNAEATQQQAAQAAAAQAQGQGQGNGNSGGGQ